MPGLALRSGKFKPPIGLERLQSANDLAFVERSHPTNLVPNRDIGSELYGDLFGGVLSYAAGVFNGVPDLGFGDADNGNNKDLAGRVFVQPFKTGRIAALREFGVGLSGSRGTQRGTVAAPFLQTYKSPAQQSIFSFRSDGTTAGTTIADGMHTRIEPQGYYYGGPVGVMWEYIKSSQVVRRATTLGRLDNQAWQATGTVTLTGERQTFRGVTPDHPLDPAHRQWGAVELTARYTRMLVDRGAFPVFANLSSQIRDANTWGVGLNWYLSRGVRLMTDYNDTRYTGGAVTGDRERERSVMTRLQHSF
jgi:phosphate-selective porin OprO/OprP